MLNTQPTQPRNTDVQSALKMLQEASPEVKNRFFAGLSDFVASWEASSAIHRPTLHSLSHSIREPQSASVDLAQMTESLHHMSTLLTTDSKIRDQMKGVFQAAKIAQQEIANLSSDQKNRGLRAMAAELRNQSNSILEANTVDVEKAENNKISDAKLERLTLNPEKIMDMADALDTISTQEDPVEKTIATLNPLDPSLRIEQVSKPLGVIGIIYEARPNVTSDAAGICLKSSNPVILRPGSDCYNTSQAIVNALRLGLKKEGLPQDCLQIVPTTHRDAVDIMLGARGQIDLIIPRGGLGLTTRVNEKSKVPTLLHLAGNCHTYIDKDADMEKAKQILFNAKMRRTGICGATESLLVHKDKANEQLRPIIDVLVDNGCELVGDERAVAIAPDKISKAKAEDFRTEFLGPKLSIQVVDTAEEAIQVVNTNSSQHTEAIISENKDAQEQFLRGVKSAIVMANTSTQFADGHQFGFGAEIGIATGSQAPRGPIGAQHLTSFAYNVSSDGAIRAGGMQLKQSTASSHAL